MAQEENETPSWLTETPAEPAPAFAPPSPTAPTPAPAPANVPAAKMTPVAAAVASTSKPEELSAEEIESLRGVIMFMRLANLGVSITIVVMASLRFAAALTNPQVWVLSFYSACGGLLICCLETQLSFIRTSIALNFGFLFNPTLRFIFYILLATICYSLGDLFSKICAGCLVGIAFYNTYVLIRYPAYRKMRDQLAKEEDERINAAMRDKVRKEAITAMFSKK